jgi:hypothetical protein
VKEREREREKEGGVVMGKESKFDLKETGNIISLSIGLIAPPMLQFNPDDHYNTFYCRI